MLVPEDILEHFKIYGAKESPSSLGIELREKECKIPFELQEHLQEVVFDGYCKPIEMLSPGFVCKPVYLKIYRMRYKHSGSEKHYSNTYYLTLKGLKSLPELGLFLKDYH